MTENRIALSAPLFCALTLLLGVVAPPAAADDLLLFPSITSEYHSEQDVEQETDKFLPAVDFFYTHEVDQARFLAEFLKSSDEADLERFQFGWRILPGKTLWLGRYHNMISFWNTQMHHGDFLQTSLSRPTVANYEDDLGVLPAHISGFLLDSSATTGDSEIDYMAGFGIGPSFNGTALQPLDLLNPVNPGKLAGSFRLGYHPEAGNPNQFGVALGYARIPFQTQQPDPASGLTVDEAQQTVLSSFLNFERDRFHLMGELFVFDDVVSGPGNSSRYTTISAYLQPEFKLGGSERTTLYARVEATPQAKRDGYLSLFNEFSPHQAFVGTRFDIGPFQAIKVEVGRSSRQDGLQFNSISAQWSMMLPL